MKTYFTFARWKLRKLKLKRKFPSHFSQYTNLSTEKNILDCAKSLFMQFGLKSVTMDDIARKNGVSKKTIYQFFKDKSAIIQNTIKGHFENHKQSILEAVNNTENAVQALFQISLCMKKQTETVNPALIYDLQKYYPMAYGKVLEFKQEFMQDLLISILNQGIKEGLFRKEINVEILAILRIEEVQLAFDNVFPREKFDFRTVHVQMFEHFIHGILTEKGREQYNFYVNHEQKA